MSSSSISSDATNMKTFNTTGTCFPDKHYMVDITERLEIIKSMVARGEYFCINRGRQYGKTTTLKTIGRYMSSDYSIFQLSLEGVSDTAYTSVEKFCATFTKMLSDAVYFDEVKGISNEAKALLEKAASADSTNIGEDEITRLIPTLCKLNQHPLILIIDEVDQAGNWESFIKFLGILRKMYLNRDLRPTFQSVILAGVYDVKNLKLKLRPDEQHQYNSPWNIAVPFDVDMSLSKDGIRVMLDEYRNDNHVDIDTEGIAQLIRDYTSGYPYLVSRLCQLMHNQHDWSNDGFLKAVKSLLWEKNTLFDDMNKKLEQFPDMRSMIENILYRGKSYTFNINAKEIEISSMFGITHNKNGQVAITNRIFETILYEKFVAESVLSGDKIYNEAQLSKPDFVKNGKLDMPQILSRFVKTFNEIYGDQEDTFLEEEGRRYFLLFVKPIINGVGNYYIESQTRDGLRTDLIIDYLGKRYIIEMKIWRGESYNKRGEEQLSEYLSIYDEPIGYMLSFCFNKNKQQGLKSPIKIGDKTLIEAVV